MSELMRPYDIFNTPFSGLFGRGDQSYAWLPPVDIRQTDDEFVVDLEVPGFQPDEIEIEAQENVLTIQGLRDEESQSGEGTNIRKERHYGRFVRRFNLPRGASTENIDASVKDGVLTLRIPHAVATTTKKIEVS